MVWNWLRRHPSLIDAMLVLALAGIYIGRTVHFDRLGLGLPLAVLQVGPLLARRRAPRVVLATVAAATIVEAAVYRSIVPVALAVAIYTVAAHLDRRRAFVAAAAATCGAVLTTLARDGYKQAVPQLVLYAAAWILGDNLRTRRAYLHELEEKAERLEREQAAESARAVAEEQARIARELHDVIAHNVSVMVVQAAAANDVFDSRPDRVREALRAIESTGRSALGELRRLLDVVRDGTEFAPQPSVEDLDALVEQVRAAGLEVVVSVEGDAYPLPSALDLSAYRIVQEALTNTLKHAHATRADVAFRYDADGLEVRVTDNGRGASNGDRSGHGLIGMRERVVVFGGTLVAGPDPAGGFAVSARLPI